MRTFTTTKKETMGNRRLEIRHRLRTCKKKAWEMLTCEESLPHRSRRLIEPEAVFGQMKANKHYNCFRHFGKDLITMDFAAFAIAFNIGKIQKFLLKDSWAKQNQ